MWLHQASSTEVDSLLRAAWLASTLPFVAALIPSSKLNAVRQFVLHFAGRGKIMGSSSRKLSVPQRYFVHFYILGVIWTTFLLVATWLYACKPSSIVSELYSSTASHSYQYGIWRSVFLLLLMEAHVLRRLFESIYVFCYSPSARMNPYGYIIGLYYYMAAPLSLCSNYSIEVFKYSVSKDRMQVTTFGLWDPLLQLKWYVWIGGVVFFWGWIHQRRCHAILGSLRKNGGKVDEYVIPEGDLFEYVSSPHYLAEIVMYGGLVIASGFSDLTIWFVFAFVVVNLTLAAGETHRWYLRKFENYPRNRRAIIPYVY